jgi:hypothetical protein
MPLASMTMKPNSVIRFGTRVRPRNLGVLVQDGRLYPPEHSLVARTLEPATNVDDPRAELLSLVASRLARALVVGVWLT